MDKALSLNLFSHVHRSSPIRDGKRVIGFEFHESWYRLSLHTVAPDESLPLRGCKTICEPIATARQRWLFAPDEFLAAPGVIPARTVFDPSQAQRFVMLDATYRFASEIDTFGGFGTGQTHPTGSGGGRRILATAIGVIMSGTGRFERCLEGTYVYGGALSETGCFSGCVTLCVLDRDDALQAFEPLPGLSVLSDPEPGVEYLLLRGEAVPNDPVSPYVAGDGRQIGLVVEQGLRLQHHDYASDKSSGKRAIDGRIGKITAYVQYDPRSAKGTAVNPIPFTAVLKLVFLDPSGSIIGSITADTTEGRVFNLSLLGQPAIRFGGVGRIREGTGPFEGITGLITDNSVVVFDPHLSVSTYVLRIDESFDA